MICGYSQNASGQANLVTWIMIVGYCYMYGGTISK